MLELNAVTNEIPRVAGFYHGKSIFLTGATGFVGSVLLEDLLRSCPGIKSIYILIRTKKNVHPEVRKEEIFNKKIFEHLKKETPELLRKVCVIFGNTSLPNLGMNEDQMHLLHDEVSIVFHCAAFLSFNAPYDVSLISNVLSLSSVIELCRKMRKFEVLVYTSTAYSNSNHLNFSYKEEVYRLPFRASQFLDALKNEDKEKLQDLIAHCKPDWPNWYCFSKCLAENVIVDTASDIPVAIIRPSIVFSTWKYPFPGYVEENTATILLSLAVGNGLIKVINMDPKCRLNLVPVDIVANAHVLAAWSVGKERCVSPLVVNCTATESLHVRNCEYLEAITQMSRQFPLPRSFEHPSNVIIVSDKYLYRFMAFYYHYLPSIVLDGMLKILGKKTRMYSLYRFLDIAINSVKFFLNHSCEFQRDNLEYLDKLMHPEDKKVWSLDFKDATLHRMLLSLPEGSPFYDWKTDKKSPRERQKMKQRRHTQICCIQVFFLITCSLLFYLAFTCIFC